MKKNLQIGKKIALALMLLVTASVVNAADRYLINNGGNWNQTSSWAATPAGTPGASVPVAGDNVFIQGDRTVNVTAAAECSNINFADNTAFTGIININSGVSLTVSGTITIPRASNPDFNRIVIGAGILNAGNIAFTNGGGQNRHSITLTTGSLIVSGDITTDNTGGSATITATGAATIRVGGNFFSNGGGTFTPGTASTVEYDGTSNQSIPDAAYGTLIISGSATKTLSAASTVATSLRLSGGTLAAGTNLSMGAAGTPSITRTQGSITGTLQGGNDYDLLYFGNSVTTGPESSNAGLRTFTVNLNPGQTVTLDANKAPDGDLTILAGTLDLSTFTASRSGAGGTMTISNGATLRIGGTNTLPGNYNTHSIGALSTIVYGGTAQTIAALNSGQVYGNLTLSGSGNKNFPAARTVNGTLSIQGTAVATGTTPTYGASAILEYAGSSAQTTTNVEFPTTVNVDLRINNAAGVTLNNAKTLTGTLAFTVGDLITTPANLLTISGTWNGLGSGASATSHVAGPLSKIGGSDFTFPIGNGTLYRPISISTLSASATVRATYFLSNPRTFGTAGTGPSLPIKDVSLCEYWDLDDGPASITAFVGLQYSSTSPCNAGGYIGDPASLLVAHWNGSTWENLGAAPGATGTNMTAATASTFSPFTIGTSDAGLNGLPVTFTNVKAFEKGNGVQIDFTNSTESDMSEYVIERSANGVDFTAIGQLAPRSNQFDVVSYTFMDVAPLAGTNFYRVKAVELTGKNVFSKSLRVDIGRSPKGISLYPNPVRGAEITIGFSAVKGQYNLNVVNTAGQVVYRQTMNHAGGTVAQTVSLPAALKAGVYNVLISGDNYKETKTFVIQ